MRSLGFAFTLALALPIVGLVLPEPAAAVRSPKKRERPRKHRMMSPASFDFAADGISAEMGATPGGAQDIEFFRSRVASGEIPHPNVFTPEGLLSDHDLPVKKRGRCQSLLCIAGEAIPAGLIVQPEVRYLAQLGFSSGIDPKTFRRAPLSLVAVIDKSGSMSGEPLELVKESLIRALDELGPDDQLSIVLYGDRAHVYLKPTQVRNRRALARSIRAIESQGSTAMEDGLRVGFDLARAQASKFKGSTRVMLFTDERPNVGRTDATSFMGMARAASKSGIGMTTIGVGVQFGAELATEVSSVRGGNLFFFPELGRMQKVFREDFDTMITELAYDLEFEVRPAQGMKIAGVYGIPGKALTWTKDGAIRASIETIFLSRRKGAIFIALAPAGRAGLPETKMAGGAAIANVSLKYLEAGGERRRQVVPLPLVKTGDASLGLQRGRVLIDQATALAKATALHHESNDQEGAYRIIHALAGVLRGTIDSDLASERQLVVQLESTLAKLSGHAGEPQLRRHDRVSGLPPLSR